MLGVPRLRGCAPLKAERFQKCLRVKMRQAGSRSHLINWRGYARAVRVGWQGASDAHTRMGLKGASNAARRREMLLSSGWRRFLTWVALLLDHRLLRICSLVAPYPSQKSTATQPLLFMRWLLV